MFKRFFAGFNFKYFLIFFIWSLWISLEYLLGTYSHVMISDTGDSGLPQLIAAKIQFTKYGFNHLAAYMVSGVDGASQFLLPFYNLNSTVFTILPGWLGYGLLMFTQRLLAAYFTFLLCRDTFRFSILPSIVAALSFSLFNYSINSFTLYHQLGIASLPFILWSLGKISFKKDLKAYLYAAALGLFVGFSNYFPIFTPYLLPFILFWLLVVWKLSVRTIYIYLVFTAFLVIAQIPGIVGLFSNLEASHRITVDKSLIEQNFVNFTIGWFYSLLKFYVLPITVICVAVFLRRSRLLIKPALLLVFPLLTVVLLKLIIPMLPFRFLKSFTYDRFELFVPFTLSIMMAGSLHVLFKRKNIFSVLFTFILICILLVGSTVLVKFKTILNYAPYRSLYSQPDLARLSNAIDSRLWRVATVTGGGIRPSYAIAYGLNAADGYLTLYPKTYQQLWSKVVSKRIADDPMRYDDVNRWGNKVYLFGPKEYDSMAEIDFDSYYDLELLSRANVKYFIAMKPLKQENLELQYSEYRSQMANWNKFSKFRKLITFLAGRYYGPPLYIYENKRAYPRFYLEDNTPLQLDSYRPDLIKLTALNGSATKLIVSVNYYPCWKAYVNGVEVGTERYMETFLAVKVPKGNNVFILKYAPTYFFVRP